MKQFYSFSPAVLIARSAVSALVAAANGTKKIFTLLLIGFFLLVSGQGFGQEPDGTIFYSNVASGNWEDLSSWSTTDNKSSQQAKVPTRFPNATDFVEIRGAHTIIVTSSTAVCNTLTLKPGAANINERTSGKIAIAYNPLNTTQVFPNTAKLSVGTLNVSIGNGTPKENGNLYIGGKGTLAVSNLIQRTGNSGQGTSALIYYEFHKGSTVEYSGGAQNIYKFSSMSDTATINSGAYKNLVLSGSGLKNVIDVNNSNAGYALTVNENLVVKGTAEFVLGSNSHTVGGNLEVQTSGAKVTGSSTVAGTGLTVGGNFVNSGTITFQTRILTVAKNFTNNAGGVFNAGSGAHTVGGNWANAGTFNSNLGTIALNGATKTISSTGTGSFNNLTVSNGTTELLSNITVNNELRLNTTIVDTKTFKTILGSSANILSEENATQQIKGTVETTRTVALTASELFGNMGFRISGSGADLGSVTVRRVTGTPFTSPVNGNNSVNRQFYVSNASGSLNGLNTAIEMNFPAHDIPAPAAASYDIYRHTVVSGNNVIETLANASVDPTYKYKVNNAQKFGMYTISSNITPLPVELAWFKAERQAKGVNLTWQTASEKDNSGFEVQVSTDGKHFSKVGFVKSAVTTSSVAQRYSFLHQNLAAGTRYYRLAQIDLDGTTTYSNVKAIDMNGLKTALAAYPNPFEGQVTVQLPTGAQREVRAILTNAFGQVLSEQKADVSELGQLTVDMSSAKTSGMYFLQVADNGSKHTFKLIKK